MQLPTDYAFDPGTDAGTHTFSNSIKLFSIGSKYVSATDTGQPSITGQQNVIVIPEQQLNYRY